MASLPIMIQSVCRPVTTSSSGMAYAATSLFWLWYLRKVDAVSRSPVPATSRSL